MPKLIRRRGFFDLFGCDFMVSTCPDRSGRLLLLEVNTNPALSLGECAIVAADCTFRYYTHFKDVLICLQSLIPAHRLIEIYSIKTPFPPSFPADNSVLADLLPGVVDGALDLVLKVQGPEVDLNRSADSSSAESLPGAYSLLYDESLGFEFESATRKGNNP
jgi:hypothetical protein